MMNSRVSMMRGSTMSKRTNRTSMFNQKKDRNANKLLSKFKKTFEQSSAKKLKRTTSLPTLEILRGVDNNIRISKLAGSSNLKNFFRFMRRVRPGERKFWYRSWSTSPHRTKTLYKKVPNFEYEAPEMPNKVKIYLTMQAARGSFVAFTGVDIHEHNHRKTPHVHNPRMCGDIRTISGYDKNRNNRFYFTKYKTPVRVYFNYDNNLNTNNNNNNNNNKVTTNTRISSSLLRSHPTTNKNKKFTHIGEEDEEENEEQEEGKVDHHHHNHQNHREHRKSKNEKKHSSKMIHLMNNPVNLNGRKLSANSLRNTKISPHFLEEAKYLLFSNDSMSFFPPVEIKEFVRSSMTLAEMAVLPLNNHDSTSHGHITHNQSQHSINSHQPKASVAQHHSKESHAQVKHSMINKQHGHHQSTNKLSVISSANESKPRNFHKSDALNEITED